MARITINSTSNSYKLPDRLRQLTEEKGQEGKTLRNIAVEAGAKLSSLSAWQCGTKVPQADSILLLCKYFNVSADYLLGLSDVRQIDSDAAKVAVELQELEKEYQELTEEFELMQAKVEDMKEQRRLFERYIVTSTKSLQDLVDRAKIVQNGIATTDRKIAIAELKHKAAHDILQSDFEQSTDGDEKP